MYVQNGIFSNIFPLQADIGSPMNIGDISYCGQRWLAHEYWGGITIGTAINHGRQSGPLAGVIAYSYHGLMWGPMPHVLYVSCFAPVA
jgi:hypothetical protein